MTDANREYELEQAVRTLGACMKDLRICDQWPEPTSAEAVYLAGLRLQIAEGKRKVAALLARDPEIAGASADPENTALR